MKFTPATTTTLNGYEIADSNGILGIWNERGDVTATVHRSDGTFGHAYGGPVYNPDTAFLNTHQRCELDQGRWCRPDCGCMERTLSPAELHVATEFAKRVGWMP